MSAACIERLRFQYNWLSLGLETMVYISTSPSPAEQRDVRMHWVYVRRMLQAVEDMPDLHSSFKLVKITTNNEQGVKGLRKVSLFEGTGLTCTANSSGQCFTAAERGKSGTPCDLRSVVTSRTLATHSPEHRTLGIAQMRRATSPGRNPRPSFSCPTWSHTLHPHTLLCNIGHARKTGCLDALAQCAVCCSQHQVALHR